MVDSLHWSPHYASHFKVILECVLKKNLSFFFIYFCLSLPCYWSGKVASYSEPIRWNLKSPFNWTLNSLHMKLGNCFCVEVLFVRGVQRQLSSFCPRLKALSCWERYLQEWLDFKCTSTFFSRLSASWSVRTLLWTTSVVILSCGPGTWLMIQTEQGGYTKQSHFRKLV